MEIDDEGTSAVRQLASRIRKKKGVVKATAWTKRANNHSRMKGSVDAKKRSVGQVSRHPYPDPDTLALTFPLRPLTHRRASSHTLTLPQPPSTTLNHPHAPSTTPMPPHP